MINEDFAVICRTECYIEFMNNQKVSELRTEETNTDLKILIHYFKITNNYKNVETCVTPSVKTVFEMNSNKLIRKKKNEEKVDQWNGGSYKIQSTVTKGSDVKQYIPFMIKNDQTRTANVIFVVNNIPLYRLYVDLTSSTFPRYELPFAVQVLDKTYDKNSNPDPFNTITYQSQNNNGFKNDLISKWTNLEEHISMTLLYSCSKQLI